MTNELEKSRPDGESLQPPDLVIPLIKEDLTLGKESIVKGTVRLTKVVHERPEMIDELLASDNLEVERVPRDEIVQAAPAVRMEGDVMVIPVLEEVLVITKQLRLKEELRILKKRTFNEHHQEVTLRMEELVIERLSSNKTKE